MKKKIIEKLSGQHSPLFNCLHFKTLRFVGKSFNFLFIALEDVKIDKNYKGDNVCPTVCFLLKSRACQKSRKELKVGQTLPSLPYMFKINIMGGVDFQPV